MKVRWGVGMATAACLLLLATSCTGGQETEAQTLDRQQPPLDSEQPSSVDPAKKLEEISPAIPVYTGATFQPDLTRRDSVMIQQEFGPNSEVMTLETDDSFPQVWHYYVTYLAQFRAYEPPEPYPPGNQEWRTLEVHLNEAMQDPFIPGDTLNGNDKKVILQVTETEAEPATVIRYIVTPEAASAPLALQ